MTFALAKSSYRGMYTIHRHTTDLEDRISGLERFLSRLGERLARLFTFGVSVSLSSNPVGAYLVYLLRGLLHPVGLFLGKYSLELVFTRG